MQFWAQKSYFHVLNSAFQKVLLINSRRMIPKLVDHFEHFQCTVRKVNIFSGPFNSYFQQEQLQKWNRAIPRQDRPLTVKDWVCSDHFHDSDIERYFPDIIIGDQTIKGELRKKPQLKPDAVPSIFGGPSYLSKPAKKKRRAPVDRGPPAKQKKNSESQQVGPSCR